MDFGREVERRGARIEDIEDGDALGGKTMERASSLKDS